MPWAIEDEPEALIAQLAAEYCPYCSSLDSCRSPVRGSVCTFDDEASQRMGYPVWRWRPCGHSLLAQVDRALGERFAGRSFKSFRAGPNKAALDTCWAYAHNYPALGARNGLLIYGPPGTGKTHLAAAILRVVVAHGGEMSFAWVHVPSQIDNLGAYTSKRFLVLDDLSGVAWSPSMVRVMHGVVNHRYEQQLPTVITTNQGREQLEKAFGADLVDRLYEMCQIVATKGTSMRRQGQEGEPQDDSAAL